MSMVNEFRNGLCRHFHGEIEMIHRLCCFRLLQIISMSHIVLFHVNRRYFGRMQLVFFFSFVIFSAQVEGRSV